MNGEVKSCMAAKPDVTLKQCLRIRGNKALREYLLTGLKKVSTCHEL